MVCHAPCTPRGTVYTQGLGNHQVDLSIYMIPSLKYIASESASAVISARYILLAISLDMY